MRTILNILVLLTLPATLFAEVKIPYRDREKNRGLGICAWCSIETSARFLKIKTLYGLSEKRNLESQQMIRKFKPVTIKGKTSFVVTQEPLMNNFADTKRITDQLDELGVKYHCDKEDTFHEQTLYDGINRPNAGGVVIFLKDYKYTKTDKLFRNCFRYQAARGKTEYHAVLLTDLDSEYVKFIDSNDTRRVWIASRRFFDKHWTGSAIYLTGEYAKEKKSKQTPMVASLPKPKPKKEVITNLPAKKVEPIKPANVPARTNTTWITILQKQGMSEEEAQNCLKRLMTEPKKK